MTKQLAATAIAFQNPSSVIINSTVLMAPMRCAVIPMVVNQISSVVPINSASARSGDVMETRTVVTAVTRKIVELHHRDLSADPTNSNATSTTNVFLKVTTATWRGIVKTAVTRSVVHQFTLQDHQIQWSSSFQVTQWF